MAVPGTWAIPRSALPARPEGDDVLQAPARRWAKNGSASRPCRTSPASHRPPWPSSEAALILVPAAVVGSGASCHAPPDQLSTSGRVSARPTAHSPPAAVTTSVSSTWWAPADGTGTARHAPPAHRHDRPRDAAPASPPEVPTAHTEPSGADVTASALAYVSPAGSGNRSSAAPVQRCATGRSTSPDPSRPTAQAVPPVPKATSCSRACSPFGAVPTALVHPPSSPRASSSGRVSPPTRSWPAASTAPPRACTARSAGDAVGGRSVSCRHRVPSQRSRNSPPPVSVRPTAQARSGATALTSSSRYSSPAGGAATRCHPLSACAAGVVASRPTATAVTVVLHLAPTITST